MSPGEPVTARSVMTGQLTGPDVRKVGNGSQVIYSRPRQSEITFLSFPCHLLFTKLMTAVRQQTVFY